MTKQISNNSLLHFLLLGLGTRHQGSSVTPFSPRPSYITAGGNLLKDQTTHLLGVVLQLSVFRFKDKLMVFITTERSAPSTQEVVIKRVDFTGIGGLFRFALPYLSSPRPIPLSPM